MPLAESPKNLVQLVQTIRLYSKEKATKLMILWVAASMRYIKVDGQ
jgi:hypothetical protein